MIGTVTGNYKTVVGPDDRLVLCSDGLYERVEESELASWASSRTPEEARRELILQLGVAAVWS